MGMTIELRDQDYQYCIDYASGKTNIMALNNINRIIKAVADGTRYETRLKADMMAVLTEIQTEIEEMPMHYDPRDVSDLIQQKINVLKCAGASELRGHADEQTSSQER